MYYLKEITNEDGLAGGAERGGGWAAAPLRRTGAAPPEEGERWACMSGRLGVVGSAAALL